MAALVFGVLIATLASPAAADVTAPSPDGFAWQGQSVEWEPYRTQAWTAPAGALCNFALGSEPIVDEELVATLARFPDGSPKLQAFKGALVVRYTNLESGATVDEDLSGKALMRYFENGAYTMYLYGPVGVGFNAEDRYPRGVYTLDGFHVVHTGPERTDRRMVVDAGTEHNVCDDLA